MRISDWSSDACSSDLNSPLMEMQSSRCPPPHPREVPTMKISARTAAHARWTAQDLIDATSLRLSTLRTFATTPGAHGCNDIRPLPRRELRGRYLVKLTPLILFRVRSHEHTYEL